MASALLELLELLITQHRLINVAGQTQRQVGPV